MALPEADEESDPAFMHHGKTDLPVVEDGGLSARLIAGSAFGATSLLATASDTLYADVTLPPRGRKRRSRHSNSLKRVNHQLANISCRPVRTTTKITIEVLGVASFCPKHRGTHFS